MKQPSVRRAQKASLYLKKVSELFLRATQDNPELKDLFPNRVSFSSDASICTVHFISPHGKPYFDEKLSLLKLYKPSLRAAIAKKIKARRVPDFVFRYDTAHEKQEAVEILLEQLKRDGKL